MHRAVPPLDAGVVRRPSIRARLLATAALVFATACLDDPSSAPDDGSVRLAISAQVIGGRTVAIEVSYRRSGSGSEGLVRLKSTPERVTVQPGTVQQPVTVDVTPCVNDPQRVRIAGRERACPLVIVLRLLDDDGDEIDSELLEPEAPEPGETVTLPTVTLRQPELVLAPGSLSFEATKGGELPAVQVVEVSNGGGGSLGALSLEIDGGAEWLDASIGEGRSTVVVQPSTTALAPGSHETTVLVYSDGVGNSPQAIAITYEIAAIPTYALTILGDGTGTGRVTSEPDGIDCTITEGVASGACSASFDGGTLVFLDATGAEGSAFDEWRGACEGDGGCAVTMTEARTVTATFTLRLHTVVVNPSGNGSGRVVSEAAPIDCTIANGIASGTCTAQVPHGTSLTFEATSGTSSRFDGWDGACSGTGSCVIVVQDHATLIAAFSLVHHELAVTGAGGGDGSVTSSPGGIACEISQSETTGQCAAPFLAGTVVTLTATAGGASQFAGWSGACSGTGDCVVTMAEARAVTATFSPPLALTITGAGNGTGLVTSAPAGIECAITGGESEGACSEQFEQGSTVTLTATPGENSELAGWSGACSDASTTCTVPMTEALSVTVTFRLIAHQLTVTGSGPGSGSVASEPSGIACTIESGVPSGACVAPFTHGTTVTLVPDPGANSIFVGWSGACSGSGPTCSVAMLKAETVGAIFDLVAVPLEVQGGGSGSGVVISDVPGIRCTITEGVRSGDCLASFPHGTTLKLRAEPAEASTFAGWSGACAGTGECIVTMLVARQVTVTFQSLVQVRVLHFGSGSGRVTSDPAGIDCRVTGVDLVGVCLASFVDGTPVTMIAEPAEGSLFDGWRNCEDGAEGNRCTQIVRPADGAFGFEPRFELASHSLTVAGQGTGAGRVTSTPAGIDCSFNVPGVPADCEEHYAHETTVALTASPDEGSRFVEWGGACTGSGPCNVTMDAARAVTATFERTHFSLTIHGGGNGNGRVRSQDEAIDCIIYLGKATDGTCSADYAAGTEVQLAVSFDDSENEFTGWSGACTGSESHTCVVPMTKDQEVTASFDLEATLVVEILGDGDGMVTSEPGDIACAPNSEGGPTVCEDAFAGGTMVTLTATTGESSEFLGWDGDCEGVEPTCTVTIDGAKAVGAEFQATSRFISVNILGQGGGTVVSSPEGIDCTRTTGFPIGDCFRGFPSNEPVVLTATPNVGSIFAGWTEGCAGTSTTCTLPMDQSYYVTAVFELDPTLTLTVTGSGSGIGRVRSQPDLSPAIDCLIEFGRESGACSATWARGTRVELSAEVDANSGNVFGGWSGICTGTGQPCVLPSGAGGAVDLDARFDFDECAISTPHVLYTTVSGQLDSGDCRLFSGIYRDRHAITVDEQTLYQVVSGSSGMPSELRVFLADGGLWFSRSATGGSHRVLAPPGTVFVDVVNTVPNDLGGYALQSRATSAEGCGSGAIRTTFGIFAEFALAAGDCGYIASTRTVASPSDRLTIYVPSGRTLRVTVTSTNEAFAPLIELRPGNDDAIWDGPLLGTTAGQTPRASVTLTRVGGGYMQVWITSRTAGGVGPYTIAIDSDGATGPTIASPDEARALRSLTGSAATSSSGGGGGSLGPAPPP